MGILWQKQQGGGEMVFVDILQDQMFDMRKCRILMFCEFAESEKVNIFLRKCDGTSFKFRTNGNVEVRMGDTYQAILSYNTAISTAEPGTENLGMSYANRAVCFMQLKRYSLCLADIELAKQNGYPVRLYAKLDERKAKCLKLLEKNGEPRCDEPKLSFPAHGRIPGFVDGLDLKEVKTGAKKIVAKRDFDIGHTIIIEEPFVSIPSALIDVRFCSNCLKWDANLIPCRKCVNVLFCSQKCYDEGHEKFHNIECGVAPRFVCWGATRRLAFRTVIVAVHTFGTVEALMDAIELFQKQKRIDDTNAAKQAYFEFFASAQGIEKISFLTEHRFRELILILQTVILNESQLQSKFQTEKQKLFLGHLILHHIYVIHKNSFQANILGKTLCNVELGMDNESLDQMYAYGIAASSKHMSHSCIPNVARIFVGNKFVYKIIRPVKNGQQLFVSYLHPAHLMGPSQYRAKMLFDEFYLQCKCPSCKSNRPPYEWPDLNGLDKRILPLIMPMHRLPGQTISRSVKFDRSKLAEYEKLIIEYLHGMDRQHPNNATLRLQLLLMQIWNKQLMVCMD